MGSHSSRSSTETSPSIWQRSKPIRAVWWSFGTRCEDIAVSHGKPPDNSRQRTAVRATTVWFMQLCSVLFLATIGVITGTPAQARGGDPAAYDALRDELLRMANEDQR